MKEMIDGGHGLEKEGPISLVDSTLNGPEVVHLGSR
jgi:hypothetical protein